ncbi:Prefoldin subunit-domain-containing protein [Phycomyces nitens]|nr:Prefoldin subunit-domain-containing protein [Phycomyces nitens]
MASSTEKMETNPRGIPRSPFVERVEDYVSEAEPVEVVLKKFQEAVRKVLEEKIPEIEKTLAMVGFLTEKQASDEPVYTDFELNDTLYAQAKLEATNSVYLWLGANVMLEYTFEEAADLLGSKLQTAKSSLKNTIEDLEFLRDQITTMEVNTARVYNWDVKQRRLVRQATESSSQQLGRLIGLIGTFFLAHAAYSTYEHLAYLKAVDQASTDIPIEVSDCLLKSVILLIHFYTLKIIVECLVSALVALIGVLLSADSFKNILMESEIAKQYVHTCGYISN